MSAYPEGVEVRRGAILSDDGRYRYRLTRMWDMYALPFLMLNPSTADAYDDDRTIARCVGFARTLGYGGIGVWNLYAYRATKPEVMFAKQGLGENIVGPENDRRLRVLFDWAQVSKVPVIAGWGVNAKADRVAEVLEMPYAAEVLHRLGPTTKAGAPRHPLYLKADTPLVRLVS